MVQSLHLPYGGIWKLGILPQTPTWIGKRMLSTSGCWRFPLKKIKYQTQVQLGLSDSFAKKTLNSTGWSCSFSVPIKNGHMTYITWKILKVSSIFHSSLLVNPVAPYGAIQRRFRPGSLKHTKRVQPSGRGDVQGAGTTRAPAGDQRRTRSSKGIRSWAKSGQGPKSRGYIH